jgi:hypothetical protein
VPNGEGGVGGQGPMMRADYAGGGIVNLMSSVVSGLGGKETGHPPLGLLGPGRVGAARRVVLLVIDGLGFAHLSGARAGEAMRSGLAGPISSVFPPTTASAITTLLTGLAPRQHGLVGWYTYLREIGSVATVLPFTTRYGRFPLGRAGVSAAALYGLTPVFDRLPVASAAVLPADLADSEVSRALGGRALRVPFRSLAGLVARVLGLVRGGGRRRFIYAYWPGLDRLAHRHGVASQEVAVHLGQVDAAVALLRAGLAGSGTLLLVSADHGFVDVPPAGQLELAAQGALAASLVLPLCGEPRTAFCYLHPRAMAGFASIARAELGAAAQPVASEALVEEGWLGPGPSHPRLADRVGHWALLMGEGFTLRDRLPAERCHPMIGFHGGATAAEMQVPLLVWET